MNKEKIRVGFMVVVIILVLLAASFFTTAGVVKLFCVAFGFKFTWLIAAAVWTIALWINTLTMPNKKD